MHSPEEKSRLKITIFASVCGELKLLFHAMLLKYNSYKRVIQIKIHKGKVMI